eukprot:gene5718-6302_t
MSYPSSLIILFEGRKKPIKVTSPNTLLQNILLEAAQHFGQNPSQCSLRWKASTLDASQPIRFCNLSHNAQIDLVVAAPQPVLSSSSSSAAAKEGNAGGAVCKVALSVEGGGAFQGTFPISFSLADILQHFVDGGHLPKNLFALSPQVIYLRSTISSEDLPSSTLASLGLAGQAVRMQLRFSIPSKAATAATAPPAAQHGMQRRDEEDEDLPPFQDVTKFVLNNNEDDTSLPALLTVGRYLANLIGYPQESRYRVIRMTNSIFQSKVAPCLGGPQLLLAMGFKAHGEKQEELVLEEGVSQESLKQCWEVLAMAWRLLEVPADQLPVLPVPAPAPIPSPPSSSLNASSSTFDFFKASIHRAAPQPSRDISVTEMELIRLTARRLELEGPMEAVERCTEVLLPVAPKPSQDSMDVEGDSRDEGKSSGPTSAMVQQILSREKAEDAPLTTQAVRALQRAQRERVHSRCLVRIRFPDKVELAGYFHPRHSVADVYAWVANCLFLQPRCQFSAESADAILSDIFELYLSPPRTVLKPFRIVPATNWSPSQQSERTSETLHDLRLSPAVLIHLSWRPASSLPSLPSAEALGGYLLPELLTAAVGQSSLTVPVGVPLVEESADKQQQGKQSAAVEAELLDRETLRSTTVKTNSSKPKWLKI